MKQKIPAAFFLILLLLISGCSRPPIKRNDPIQPFYFYYRRNTTDFSDELGLISAETRDLGAETYSDLELFQLYFQGPDSASLVSPIPRGTELVSVDRSGNLLMLRLVQTAAVTTEIDLSIADACILKTALQLDGIRRVRIRVENKRGELLRDRALSENDILLYDDGEGRESREITLFFTDSDRRMLLSEKRSLPQMDKAAIPNYIVQELIDGPNTAGMSALIPRGTSLLETNLDNGVCAVDFTADFLTNKPQTQQEELLVLLSIVNSLCELDEISQVQFYVEGQPQQVYVYLDLSEPFSADTTLIGPVRADMNEFEGVLCLPGAKDSLLHSFGARIRLRGTMTREEALLGALFSRPNQNGIRNPLLGYGERISVTSDSSYCTVNLPPELLDTLDDADLRIALRSITATLTTIPGTRWVRFTSGGQPLEEDIFTPERSWFCDERFPE